MQAGIAEGFLGEVEAKRTVKRGIDRNKTITTTTVKTLELFLLITLWGHFLHLKYRYRKVYLHIPNVLP